MDKERLNRAYTSAMLSAHEYRDAVVAEFAETLKDLPDQRVDVTVRPFIYIGRVRYRVRRILMLHGEPCIDLTVPWVCYQVSNPGVIAICNFRDYFTLSELLECLEANVEACMERKARGEEPLEYPDINKWPDCVKQAVMWHLDYHMWDMESYDDDMPRRSGFKNFGGFIGWLADEFIHDPKAVREFIGRIRTGGIDTDGFSEEHVAECAKAADWLEAYAAPEPPIEADGQ